MYNRNHLTVQTSTISKKTSLHQIIERDCNFFQSNSLIDYSLLIGEIKSKNAHEVRQMVHRDPSLAQGLYYSTDGKAYLLGIIDPLTKFT